MGLYKDEGAGHFSIQYGGLQAPFGGLDSSAPDAYIAPNRLLQASNFALVDNTYVSARWTPIATNWGSALQSETLVGFGEASGIFFAVTYSTSTGNYLFYTWTNLTSVPTQTYILPALVNNLANWSTLTFYAINGVLYFSGAGIAQIFQYTLPIYGNVSSAPTVLTTYLGCLYLGELNGRLLAFNTIAYQTGGTYLAQPFQVAWSAAEEQYSVWNPLVGGVPSGAGYNNIPDVEDVIAGFFSQGPNIYVIRTQGITEITPLANGISPFDFNHLWAAPKGMGTRYPSTVTQYGSVGTFLSAVDIISMGYSGINVLSGPYKSAIYEQITQQSSQTGAGLTICGTLTPFNVNYESDLYYVLTMLVSEGVGDLTIYNSYFVNVATMETMSFPFASLPGPGQFVGSQVVNSFTTGNQISSQDTLVLGFQVPGSYPIFYYIPPVSTDVVTEDTAGVLIFPAEEISPYQEISVDGVLLYLSGTPGETLSVNVSGVSFQAIVLTSSEWTYYRSMPNPVTTNIMVTTQMNPQLQLTYIGYKSMEIGMVRMYGSYTEGRPF